MPRHPRLFIPGATYHVYCRVARGEFVFDDPLEAEEFVLAAREVRDLPWWKDADNLDEVASPQRYPESRTFDNRPVDDDRVGIDSEDFITLFEYHSGQTIKDLRSPLRRPRHVQARIELATLAAACYGLPSTDIACAIRKHPTSVARWISIGLRKQVEDSAFRERIDHLDRRISWSARNNA